MLTLDTNWQSAQPLDWEAARARLRGGAYTDATVELILRLFDQHARALGYALAPSIAQVAHETANFRYGGQVEAWQWNFAGIGATNDGAAGVSWRSPEEGVMAYFAHHGNYRYGEFPRWPAVWQPYKAYATRHVPVQVAGYGGTVQTIGGFTNGRWAWSPGVPLGSLDNGYARAIVRIGNELLLETQEPSMAPKIALASGHHNSSGGDAFEREQTGPLCAAVAQHCRALGMDVRCVQPDDGMGYIAGSLDVVGNTVTAWARSGWVPDVFLECHTEGGGGRGAFAIYPDWAPDVDEAVRDTLGPLAAGLVAQATGLGMGAGGDGVMSERQTGVGGQGSRLGIFRTTATLQSTRRLIIEYGAHDKQPDLGIATIPGFADKCGQATAEAFADYLGWGGSLANNGGIYAAHQRLWNGGIYAAQTALWG
jgi:hypothetical protein